MRRFYYDLHVHSCLSPCADDDNTPNNLAGMASLCGLEIVALTDHNSCKNCPAFFAAAARYGIVPVPGMELTTSEDIHVICLFPALSDALAFGEAVDARRTRIKNRPEVFGEQLILDAADTVIGKESDLLSNATTISFDEAPALVSQYGGVCYPAHIDRQANGVISVLGTFPPTPAFSCAELHDGTRAAEYTARYGLSDKKLLVSSDAHFLTDLHDREQYLELEAAAGASDEAVRKALMEALR